MAGKYARKYQKNEDFDEGEVWGSSNNNNSNKDSTFFITSPRMIPRTSSSDSGNNTNSTSINRQSSAPLDIPNWSKIYGKTVSQKKKNSTTSSSSSTWASYNNNNNDDDNGHYYGNGYNGNDDGDGDDDDDGMVPPHEYLARKLARNQISSFSVYEGIGRTLKGRDLSKVRNTILTKTGFIE